MGKAPAREGDGIQQAVRNRGDLLATTCLVLPLNRNTKG